MLVPLKWLSEFVEFDLTPDQVAEMLTMGGLEVDGVIERFRGLSKVITAQVLDTAPHPNADKLKLAKVDTGTGELTVVCGAPNLRQGMVTALALPGAVLFGGQEVGKAKIRGVESVGMLCSYKELEINDDHSGVADLDDGLAPGKGIVEALGLETHILEISITPNRGDALSILGVARDLAALLGVPVRRPAIELQEEATPVEDLASVSIEHPEGCPRYAARVVRGVKVGPSPLWMADRLTACGLRPISNVVDVTNYVNMERGQPLHAFDYHFLADHAIVVRTAHEGERFITLDDKERTLQEGMLLICDAEKPVALAGVMGGQNSEINDDTVDVLIESAFFDPGLTRRTAKALGMSTDASYRFERGIDRDGCAEAADRAAQLIQMTAGGRVAKGIIDNYPLPYAAPRLSLSARRTSRFLGIELGLDEVARPLADLGLPVEKDPDGDTVTAEPPAFRTDLERPVDLEEEVARLVGYNRIPARLPRAGIGARPRAWRQQVREQSRDLMAAAGLCEAITLSFGHPDWPQMLRLGPDDPRRRVVRLMNPLSEDQSVLRTSLLPGLLGAVRRNLAYRVAEVALFEVGKVFIDRPDQKQPLEPSRLTGALSGLARPVSWYAGEDPAGFAHARGAVEYLLDGLGVSGLEATPFDQVPPYLDPGAAALLSLDCCPLGEVGAISPKVAKAFDLDRPVFVFDLDFDLLVERAPRSRSFRHLPRFPEVVRDQAIVFDEATPAGEVLAFAREAAARDGLAWLEGVSLFDLYRGKPLAKGQKSLGLRFTYRDPERTLTEDEVIPAHQALVEAILGRFGGELRG